MVGHGGRARGGSHRAGVRDGHGGARAWLGTCWLELSCAPFDLCCSRWGQGSEVMLVDKVREREVAGCMCAQVRGHVLAYANGVACPSWYRGAGVAWVCSEGAGH